MKRYFAASVVSMSIFSCSLALAGFNTTVSTPKGTKVPVYVISTLEEMSAVEINAWNAKTKAAYPKATFISSSTRKYNCHSYAWYWQSSANNAWMSSPKSYWTDGSYLGYCSATPPSGSKVNYPNGDHSAISLGGGYVQSKWGQGPLMKHPVGYGPSIYNMSCYYTYKRS
jgi:hypothetical protein